MVGKPVVVIIEDEALPRLQAAELFDLGGMSVEVFATAEEAVAFVQAHADQVACIFTDLRLGAGADGLDVVRQVSASLPDVVIVLTSGARAAELPSLPENARFIAKPWSPSDVMEAIRSTASGATASARHAEEE